MHRRQLLKTLIAAAAAGIGDPEKRAWGADAKQPSGVLTGDFFDYARLKGHARALAAQPYRDAATALPKAVKDLDWDEYQSIRFRDDHALWAGAGSRFRVKFFHLGLFFQQPVQMYEVVAGRARSIAYEGGMFDYGKSSLRDANLPSDLGFAGFRVNFSGDWVRDITAFLGASYFRAVGAEMQYGLSARGLAINSGMPSPEEFPRFTTFWLERSNPNSGLLTVYALLDSASAAGAFRFHIRPSAVLSMDVDAAIYPRKEIERIGIAPLTSMYLHGENDRRVANDWRPEVHDSDGLAMWRGNGEWIWRPLTNPANVGFNAYADDNPRGFGLLQRDRNFDHYQDDGVFYERRPSLWVEPRSSWGKGAIQLVELPTPDETQDNIVAFWNPAEPPKPGQELLFSYRLHWGGRAPISPPLAVVVATRTGIGGVVGRPRTYMSWRFTVDFAGGELSKLGKNVRIEPVITASRGEIEVTSARPLEGIRGYRAMFDYKPVDRSTAPVTLRLFLRANGKPLSETWLYEWIAWEQRLPPLSTQYPK
ncbi:MAG TPA: glucan biosynthesis protein D [Burkholderiales bacterium]|nr:glucan biosynthesis protein D [Burkholderiales bacterium]